MREVVQAHAVDAVADRQSLCSARARSPTVRKPSPTSVLANCGPTPGRMERGAPPGRSGPRRRRSPRSRAACRGRTQSGQELVAASRRKLSTLSRARSPPAPWPARRPGAAVQPLRPGQVEPGFVERQALHQRVSARSLRRCGGSPPRTGEVRLHDDRFRQSFARLEHPAWPSARRRCGQVAGVWWPPRARRRPTIPALRSSGRSRFSTEA